MGCIRFEVGPTPLSPAPPVNRVSLFDINTRNTTLESKKQPPKLLAPLGSPSLAEESWRSFTEDEHVIMD